jgi:NTE family protein
VTQPPQVTAQIFVEDNSKRANQALVVAATAMLLVSFVGTATNIAVPVLEEDFPAVPLSTISWVVSGFNVTTVTFMLLGGRVADRLGRRLVFLGGMLLFALGALLSGLAPGIELIIAARVVQAIGAAMVLPSSLAAVLPLFPRERHATVVSTWSSMGILGAAAAPTVAAGLLEVSSWRALFLIATPIALLAFLGGQMVLDIDADAVKQAPLDIVGTVAGTTAVGGLVLVIVQGRVWGWTDSIILTVAAIAVVNAVLFVQSSLFHPEPLVDLGLLRIRSFSVVTFASALLATSTTASWFLYPLFMIEIWDYSILQVGLAMTPGPLALMVLTIFAGRFADRRGYRRMLVLGASLATVGTAWMALWLAPDTTYWFAFLPGTLGIGSGMALMLGPGNSAALRDVPESQLAAANALYNTARLFGGALGVAVVASVIGDAVGIGRLDAFRTGWWAMVAAMALAPVVLWVAYPRDARG